MRSIGLGVDMEYEGNTLSQKDTKTVFYAIGPSQIWKASRTTPRVQLRGRAIARSIGIMVDIKELLCCKIAPATVRA